MAHLIDFEGHCTLADIIAPGLDVLFVGYNPNPLAVASRHYYARTANRFWEDLYEAGFVPRILRGPDEDVEILRYGLGLTDLIKRPTTNIDGLTAAEFRTGVSRLDGVLATFQPRFVCFNGLGLGHRYARWGSPPPGVTIRAIPSSSPRNQGRKAERLAALKDLNAAISAR